MIIDLDTPFSEGLSDETVAAIAELLNDLAVQWESHFFHRIRGYQARLQTDLFDSTNPGAERAKTDLNVPLRSEHETPTVVRDNLRFSPSNRTDQRPEISAGRNNRHEQ